MSNYNFFVYGFQWQVIFLLFNLLTFILNLICVLSWNKIYKDTNHLWKRTYCSRRREEIRCGTICRTEFNSEPGNLVDVGLWKLCFSMSLIELCLVVIGKIGFWFILMNKYSFLKNVLSLRARWFYCLLFSHYELMDVFSVHIEED